MHTLCWNDFSHNEDVFHIAGLTSEQVRGANDHTHVGFTECIWMVSGHMRHRINHQEQILSAGQFVMIREQDQHDFRPIHSESFAFRNIAFKTTTLDEISKRYVQDLPPDWSRTAALPAIWTLNGDALERMEQRIARLALRSQKQIYIDQFILDVLTDPPQRSIRKKIMPDWLEHACEALNKPSKFSIGTAALFSLAARSPEHTSRELKRCTGETPTGLVNRLRLEYAAKCLILSSENITTIAYDCGFETLSYFSDKFKKRFGTTPRDYRKKHRTAVFGG